MTIKEALRQALRVPSYGPAIQLRVGIALERPGKGAAAIEAVRQRRALQEAS